MNKTTKAFALLFTAGLVLAGCGQKQDSTATTQAQAKAETTTAAPTTATPTTAAPTTVAQAKQKCQQMLKKQFLRLVTKPLKQQ